VFFPTRLNTPIHPRTGMLASRATVITKVAAAPLAYPEVLQGLYQTAIGHQG